MSSNFADGGIRFGSQKALVTAPSGYTPTWTATTFVFKNVEVPYYDAKRSPGTDEVGNEDSQFFTGVIPECTGIMQFPRNGTATAPPQYSTVPLKLSGSATSVQFIIYGLTQPFEAGGETLMRVKLVPQMSGSDGGQTDPIAPVAGA